MTGQTRPRNPRRLTPRLLLFLAPLSAAALLEQMGGGGFFRAYTGDVRPVLAVAVAAACWAVSFAFLERVSSFTILSPRWLTGGGVAVGLASLLAVPAIVVDYSVGIDVSNVPWPLSLTFYPAIAFVVEVVFHVVPLTLALSSLLAPFAKRHPTAVVWTCIVAASLLEPAFQMTFASASSSRAWIVPYIGLQVWAVNVVQLAIFRNFDFASMYAVRLAYYFWWHIVWGYLRISAAG